MSRLMLLLDRRFWRNRIEWLRLTLINALLRTVLWLCGVNVAEALDAARRRKEGR